MIARMKQKIREYLDKIKQKSFDFSKISPKKAALVGIPLVLFLAVLWFFTHFSVRNVIVLGNIHYTDEEIAETVQRGLFGNNTYIVSHTRKSFSPDNMDLVDQIDVERKDEHTLQITVQERQLIGYVQYLDCDLYFDSEGRVMNSVVREEENGEEEQQALAAEAVGKSATSFVAAMEEAPLIKGLSFAWARLQEILPVEDESVFNTILGISRMVNKYSIAPDAVVFDENLDITLEYADVTVNLGPDKLIEEKLARVAAILPSIEGKKGELRMENYDGSSENIIFSQEALAGEALDEEGTMASDKTGNEETISHEYALVLRDDTQQSAVPEQQGEDQTAGGVQQSQEQTAGGVQQGQDQTAGTGGQTNGTSPGQGAQDIQINRPVLDNLQ